MDSAELSAAVLAAFPDLKTREKADRAAVIVPLESMTEVMLRLRGDTGLLFDMLADHTAVDWPSKVVAEQKTEPQIELIYQLYSTVHRHYLMVSVFLPRTEPVAPSVMQIWKIAEWQEREVYDMFGVRYSNHSDLRRVLLEDEWVGHPLLKDYKDDFMLVRPW